MIDLTKDELEHMNEQNEHDFVLINVLDNDAFNKQHIRNSVNVPGNHPQFIQIVNAITGNKNREIVLYCSDLACDASARAGRSLEDTGFSRVYDYKGGNADWFGEEQPSQVGQSDVPPEHNEWLDVIGSEPKPS